MGIRGYRLAVNEPALLYSEILGRPEDCALGLVE